MMRYLFLSTCIYMLHAAPTERVVKLSPEYFHPIHSLYHSQNNGGHYVYGYATPAITQRETKSADGVTHGGYSYIDNLGHLQTVQYTADAVHGFRVAASNLPVEDPDVAHARASHLAEFEAIKSERAQAAAVPYFNPVSVPHDDVPQLLDSQQLPETVTDLPEVAQARAEHLAVLHVELPETVTDLPEVAQARAEHLAVLHAAYRNAQAAQLGYGLPQPVQDLPEVVKARSEHLAAVQQERNKQAQLRAEIALSPIPDSLDGHTVPVQTNDKQDQPLPVADGPLLSYAAEQNAYGPYSYGYVGPHSAQSETQSADGVVQGGYSYIDAFGVVQTVNYIADKAGFRVAATNIPVDKNHLAAANTLSTGRGLAKSAPLSVQEKKIVVPASYTTDIKY